MSKRQTSTKRETGLFSIFKTLKSKQSQQQLKEKKEQQQQQQQSQPQQQQQSQPQQQKHDLSSSLLPFPMKLAIIGAMLCCMIPYSKYI